MCAVYKAHHRTQGLLWQAGTLLIPNCSPILSFVLLIAVCCTSVLPPEGQRNVDVFQSDVPTGYAIGQRVF